MKAIICPYRDSIDTYAGDSADPILHLQELINRLIAGFVLVFGGWFMCS